MEGKISLIINSFFFLALFLAFLLPPTDPDLGWHLRCGQEFWQNHTFCSQNQFTVLLENYYWPNHHWLYQVILFPIYNFLGLWGLTILNSLFLASAFFLFFKSLPKDLREEKTFLPILAIGLTIFLAWGVFSFGIRSQLLGFFFFNLILFLWSKSRQNLARAVICPLTFLLWANIHGGSVILGLVLLLFILIKESFFAPKKLLFFVFIFLLSVSATLLNPFGVAIYREAWRHFAGVNLSKLIAEWVPPTPFFWWLILLSAISLFFLILLSGGVRDFIFAFAIFPFAFLALTARRHLPFYFLLWFYLFFTTPISKNLLVSWLKRDSIKNDLTFLTVVLFLALGFFFRLPLTIHTNLSWQNYCQDSSLTYPCKAVEFLKTQGEKGNLFNRYEWGGFLIWQLPQFKIFVDGRMPAWKTPSGKSPYTIYLETLQTQPGWGVKSANQPTTPLPRESPEATFTGWQETLKDYNIKWILISPGTFMDLLLRPEPGKFGWQEIYRDKISVIYKKI
ncbi:MAG: hypothetical protein ACOZBZ_00715 [Patescibacteria group bacterium]